MTSNWPGGLTTCSEAGRRRFEVSAQCDRWARRLGWVLGLLLWAYLWDATWRHRFETLPFDYLAATDFEGVESTSWQFVPDPAAGTWSVADGCVELIAVRGREAPRVAQWVNEFDGNKWFRLRAEVATDGVEAGRGRWQVPRIFFGGASAAGPPRQRAPHAVAMVWGDCDWHWVDHFVPVRSNDERLQIALQHWGEGGRFRVRNLQLLAAKERAGFRLQVAVLFGVAIVWLSLPVIAQFGWRAILASAVVMGVFWITVHPRFGELDWNLFGGAYPEVPQEITKRFESTQSNEFERREAISRHAKATEQRRPLQEKQKSTSKSGGGEQEAKGPRGVLQAQLMAFCAGLARLNYAQFGLFGLASLVVIWVPRWWFTGLLAGVLTLSEVRQALLIYPADAQDLGDWAGSLSILWGLTWLLISHGRLFRLIRKGRSLVCTTIGSGR